MEHTLLVAMRRLRAVVARLRWPSSSWIVRTAGPGLMVAGQTLWQHLQACPVAGRLAVGMAEK